MRIKNIAGHMLPFLATLPSGRRFRIEVEAGEELDLSPALQIGLPENVHFNRLVEQGKLEIVAYAENSDRDRDVSRGGEPQSGESN